MNDRPRVLMVSMGSPAKSSFVVRLAWMAGHPARGFEVVDSLGWPYEATRSERERRFAAIQAARRQADVTVLHRVLFEDPFFEEFFKDPAPTVFDYDDAIYSVPSVVYRLEPRSLGGLAKRLARFLMRGHPAYSGRHGLVVRTLGRVTAVSAGNGALARFASSRCRRVAIVPTPVDVHNVPTKAHAEKAPVSVGWYGSPDNQGYLLPLAPVFDRLKAQRHRPVRFSIISERPCTLPGVEVHWVPWDRSKEQGDLLDFDIGIMPLTDDEWARGKCGNKALIYMAMGIPPVVSPVGVNADIVDHGRCGFHATTPGEWVQHLAALIDSCQLRSEFGTSARAKVIEGYSHEIALHRLGEILTKLRTPAGQPAAPSR